MPPQRSRGNFNCVIRMRALVVWCHEEPGREPNWLHMFDCWGNYAWSECFRLFFFVYCDWVIKRMSVDISFWPVMGRLNDPTWSRSSCSFVGFRSSAEILEIYQNLSVCQLSIQEISKEKCNFLSIRALATPWWLAVENPYYRCGYVEQTV